MYSRETVSGGVLRVITPHDVNLVKNCKALWSNTGGPTRLQWPNNKGGFETAVDVTLPAGVPLPVESPFRVLTATTAPLLGFFEPNY
jgi:hypothetical protein